MPDTVLTISSLMERNKSKSFSLLMKGLSRKCFLTLALDELPKVVKTVVFKIITLFTPFEENGELFMIIAN